MRKIIALLFIQFAVISLWANGGPVDGSSIARMGELRFLNQAEIDLQKERLSFNITGNYVEVKVVYHLKNNSNSDSGLIDYGFPLDSDIIGNEEYGAWADNNCIKDISFKIDNKILQYNVLDDELMLPTDIPSLYGEDNIEVKREWLFTQFSIGKGEEAVLEISYLVKPFFEDFATSKNFFTYYDTRRLYWDFCPAQYWGDGIVEDFEVTLRVDNHQIEESRLVYEGLPFTKDEDTYVYHTKNFDLKTANPLRINYEVNIKAYYIDQNNLFNVDNAIGIKASSSQKSYPLSNINDDNLSTTWCPIGDGIGEWIEIETKKENIFFGAIIMFGGYTKSEEAYYNNNRPKTVKVEMFGDYDQEEYLWDERTVELEDIPYDKRQISNINENTLLDFGDGSGGRKIRITILDVYKGNKYNDTCVSELYVLGYIPDPNLY